VDDRNSGQIRVVQGEKMNNLKPIFKGLGIFFLGLIVGAFIIEAVEIHVRPTYRQLIRIDFKTEQDFLAARASRENKPIQETLHRWAAVDAESDEGFTTFRDEKNKQLGDNSYLLPFALLVQKQMWSSENIQRGKKIGEGIDRGKLAVSLEKIGQQMEAEAQWNKSQQLQQGHSLEQIKQLTYSLLEQEKTEIHRKAEDVVLGKEKK
jgi:hypothetical protein